MKLNILTALPAGLLLSSIIGCSAAPGQDGEVTAGETAIESQELTACPAHSAADDQMRAAATVALNLMKAAAVSPTTWTLAKTAVLAPQRYRVQSSGTGIEFDPTDAMYSTVTDPMKAHLAIAQQDASVAKFLSDGLKYAYANTDGMNYARIITIPALATYKYPGPVSNVHIEDPTSSSNSHVATVSGKAWCGTSIVTIADSVKDSWKYTPMFSESITNGWRGSPPSAFKGTSGKPWTPFNGAVASGNPYLVVSVNGSATNWATYAFTTSSSCYAFPNFTCSGSLEIDPVPYAEPGAYYTTDGLVGTQANPYPLTNTVLYANAEHASQWATRTVYGVQEWGVFATPLTLFGSTVYKYVKKF